MPRYSSLLMQTLSSVKSGDNSPVRAGDGSVVLSQSAKDEFISAVASALASRTLADINHGPFKPQVLEGASRQDTLREYLSSGKEFASEFLSTFQNSDQAKAIVSATTSLLNSTKVAASEANLAEVASRLPFVPAADQERRTELAVAMAAALDVAHTKRSTAQKLATPELAEALTSLNATGDSPEFSKQGAIVLKLRDILESSYRDRPADAYRQAQEGLQQAKSAGSSGAEMAATMSSVLEQLTSNPSRTGTLDNINEMLRDHERALVRAADSLSSALQSPAYDRAVEKLAIAGEAAYHRLDHALELSASVAADGNPMAREGRLLGAMANVYGDRSDTRVAPVTDDRAQGAPQREMELVRELRKP